MGFLCHRRGATATIIAAVDVQDDRQRDGKRRITPAKAQRREVKNIYFLSELCDLGAFAGDNPNGSV
jgi:hypothetical protein